MAFIDFNHLKNNRFIPVCQLKLRILGSEHFIYPDVVLFLNGLPLVVVEAKFGTITTHNEKHFYRWADPFPRTLNDLNHGSSSPNDQRRPAAAWSLRGNFSFRRRIG